MPASIIPNLCSGLMALLIVHAFKKACAGRSMTGRLMPKAFAYKTPYSAALGSLTVLRKSSSVSLEAADEEPEEATQHELLDPAQLCDGTIPYPKALSPSGVMEFKKCPQSFLFQYLYGVRQPTNTHLALGSMCHEALEKVFDLEPQDRTLEHLQNLFRSSWAQHRVEDNYRHLFEIESDGYNQAAEKEWGQSGLKLLKNYVKVEDPRQVPHPNPIQREIWLRANLNLDPLKGVTAGPTASSSTDDEESFLVRGIVDRLDMIRLPDKNNKEVALRIVDYKTGKAPDFKYSASMNEKIADEAFYQLKIYALLLRERGENYSKGLDLRMLRLLFLTSESGIGQYLDLDLGETQDERDAVLQEIHVDLSNVWKRITELVSTQDPMAFAGCDRSFCYCHKCRPQFLPGTVWEP